MNDTEARDTCLICDSPVEEGREDYCERCARDYPDPLRESNGQEGVFHVKLTSGELIRFTESVIVGDWVTLIGVTWPSLMGDPDPTPMSGFIDYRRGLAVRIDHIVWCVEEKPR